MEIQEQVLARLREEIEAEVGRKMRTPKDFNFLSEHIFGKLHQTVSPTTLKRLWGYLREPVKPRSSSLNVLVQLLGYASWAAYCQKIDAPAEVICLQEAEQPDETEAEAEDTAESAPSASAQSVADEPKNTPKRRSRWQFALGFLSVIVLAVLLVPHIMSFTSQTDENAAAEVNDKYLLRQGQLFPTEEDYMKLFGITDPEVPWLVALPNYPHVALWGPEYKNWRWHNYGDSALMFPTITEAWNPGNVTQEHINTRMRDHYYSCKRLGELRLAFMKNMIDTCYVFLGVYRMDKEHSDTTKVIWERIAEECDLSRLDYIESLHN